MGFIPLPGPSIFPVRTTFLPHPFGRRRAIFASDNPRNTPNIPWGSTTIAGAGEVETLNLPRGHEIHYSGHDLQCSNSLSKYCTQLILPEQYPPSSLSPLSPRVVPQQWPCSVNMVPTMSDSVFLFVCLAGCPPIQKEPHKVSWFGPFSFTRDLWVPSTSQFFKPDLPTSCYSFLSLWAKA